jgi:hypothetical protein
MKNSNLQVLPIEDLPESLMDELLSNRFGSVRSPITKQVRELEPGKGFFVVSSEPRTFSEVYNHDKTIFVRRAEHKGELGYWILCPQE